MHTETECSQEAQREQTETQEAMCATVAEFMEHVEPEPYSGCWIWSGPYRERPAVWRDGKQRVAARVAFELFKGSIPRGRLVCHRCDCTFCVNPYHLYAGTYRDNFRDMMQRGRRLHNTSPERLLGGKFEHAKKVYSNRKKGIALAERSAIVLEPKGRLPFWVTVRNLK